jgi:Rab GTPase-binding effector protein 1
VENLNKEMSNLALVIEDLRKQYTNIQNQHQFQMDTLIRVNEQIRNDLKSLESKNNQYVKENMRLKAENIQFYGEQTRLYKELDEQFFPASSLDEANNQSKHLRTEIVKLLIANQAVNKQLSIANEKIKHLKQTNINYQESNSSVQDQLVITQSLESELERERKVRIEVENEKQEALLQLKMVKEKGQSLVDSLRQRNDQNEFEIRKLRDENQELNNQIQSLKKDSKNSLSVQEDLVKLIQSLQIELNQMKTQNDQNTASHIEVRCQSEDDFSECTSCKTTFSVTKRKHRCKHCCKVLCADCCNKTVLSGPNLRPHKVCELCHTLLDKDSAKLS